MILRKSKPRKNVNLYQYLTRGADLADLSKQRKASTSSPPPPTPPLLTHTHTHTSVHVLSRPEWFWSNSLVNVNVGDEGSVSGKPRGCADPHQVYAIPATVTVTLVTPALHCKPHAHVPTAFVKPATCAKSFWCLQQSPWPLSHQHCIVNHMHTYPQLSSNLQPVPSLSDACWCLHQSPWPLSHQHCIVNHMHTYPQLSSNLQPVPSLSDACISHRDPCHTSTAL